MSSIRSRETPSVCETQFVIRLSKVNLVTAVSDNIEELLGYSPDDFLSSRLSLADQVHADDQDIADEIFFPELTAVRQTANLRLRRANGCILCIKAIYRKYIPENGEEFVLELNLQDAKSLKRTMDDASNMVNFRSMMENTNDYIYFKDRNHVFTGASQTLVELCDPAEQWTDLLGLTDYDVFPEEYADIYYRLEKQVFAGLSIAHEIQETLSTSGKKGWVDNRKYPILDSEGEIIGLYGIARDITEQKRVEEAMEASEKRFRKLFNSSPDPVWIIDNYRFVECNDAAVSILGYPNQASLVNTHPSELSPEFQPDGESSLSKAERMMDIALEKGINRFEWVHTRKDGSNFFAEVTLSTLSIQEKPVLYCIWRDITERKRAEEELRQANIIVEKSPAILFLWKAVEGWPVEWVSRNVKLFGYTAEEFLSGATAYNLIIHPDDLTKVSQEVEEHSLSGDEFFTQQYRIVSPTNEIFWVDDRTTVVRDAEGIITHYQGVIIDISEQKKAEKEKEQLLNQLQHSQKMESLGYLAGGVAHEFNNVLGIINGFAGLATAKSMEIGDEKLIEYLKNVERAGERATGLVTQMLSFSRSGEVDDIPLNLSSLIQDDICMLRSTLPATIEIKIKIAPEIPKVLMNRTQLNQILMNLSINARDAMCGVGKLTIQLHYRHDLDENDSISHKLIKGSWVELRISDTGSGIDHDVIKKIFDPFFTTKEVGQGTGMGLSIVYRIMQDHAGHILLDSDKSGTNFRLLFPPILNENLETNELLDTHSEMPEGDGSEILVVDDEEMLAIYMSELIKDHGYKVHYETDSTDALNLYKKDPDRFSLLITDQTMPKLTGMELIDKLRAISPALPTILCSGYSDKINADIACKLDISFFSKPVEISKLMTEISSLLAMRKN